jgi:hypothetical protein
MTFARFISMYRSRGRQLASIGTLASVILLLLLGHTQPMDRVAAVIRLPLWMIYYVYNPAAAAGVGFSDYGVP